MSGSSCNAWTVEHAPPRSRLRRYHYAGFGLLCLGMTWASFPAGSVQALLYVATASLLWLEYTAYTRVRYLALSDSLCRVSVQLHNGKVWQGDATIDSRHTVILPWVISMRITLGERRYRLVLYADQFSSTHWRRLGVLLRWRHR